MLHIRTFILLLITLNSLSAREIPQKDIDVHIEESVRFGKIDAKMVHFGGYTTPECKLAVSLDGNYFYLKKVNSTCTTLTNSKGVKIICNRDKSVCKTRQELADLVNNRSVQTEEDPTTPSWCNAGRLNKTEHMICADETLGKLDKEMAKVYGAAKAHTSDREQREWLKKRNKCKSDISCIRQAYQDRILQLKEYQEEEETLKRLTQTINRAREMGCKEGDANDCVSLGVLYDEGRNGYAIDDYKAFSLYQKGCQLGSAKGCAYLGLMYANGEGVSKDLKSALQYLEEGCRKGHEKACSNAQEVRKTLSNAFRGIRKNDCYKIKEYGPQRVCLEGTGGDACYGIKDYGLQRVCREGAGGDACYGIKDYGMQRVCREGIGTDACYGLKDYNEQRSCQHFGGSTEFWLILTHYGYYTY